MRPVLLIGLAVGLGACHTYGTGTNPGTQTVKDLTGMLSLGGGGKGGPPIAYESRPPIVTPPNTNSLPEPGSGATVQNWPNDPDVMRREQAYVDSKKRTADTGNALVDPGFRLTKTPVVPRQEEKLDDQLLALTGKKREQQQLFATAKGGSAGKVDAEGNPVRSALTEPPAHYRIPDPSAPQEFEEASTRKLGLFQKKRSRVAPSEMGGGTDGIATPGVQTQTKEISQGP